MCGIAGYIDIHTLVKEEVIEKMTAAIAHRGPDGFGHKLFGNVAIGHRRLSIIDLASGQQPMCGESQYSWITYNGELYNYLEIKAELIALGYHFKTNSDTEVIISAYEKWGEACLQKFRGMFAFGIVDLKKQTVFVARDHFGIKPLFIYKSKNIVAFGSELQQFTALPEFDATYNLRAIDQYLWLNYIPAPLTVYESVTKLNAAHYVTIDFSGKVSEQKEYWNLDYSKKLIKTESEWLEATDATIRESVKAHLISDVPFGAFLSGGIDSSLVVSHMSRILDKKVETFSIGFEEEEYNELKYSSQVAEKYNTNHHIEIVKPDALAILPTMVKHYGEPYGDSSSIPTYYVCEMARKHVTMVLSGDGGDECFAGYTSHLSWLKYMPLNYRTGFRKKIYPLQEKLFPKRYPSKETIENWMTNIQLLDKNWRAQLWKDEYRANITDLPEGFDELFDSTKKFTPANRVQYMDMKTYMSDDILKKVDVASMIHSLEVRTPLIDKKVWEMAAMIPEEFNINKNSGEWRGKLILKKLLANNFPDNFVNRRKQGFSIPLSKWFEGDDKLNQLISDKLSSKNSLLNTYFNSGTINKLINSDNAGGLWSLLFMEEWLHQQKK